MGTKPARNFGGRPVEREPEPGKRTHLTIALPLPLKRKIEQAAKKRGWSTSSEAAHRLELSFSNDAMTELMLDAVRGGLKSFFGGEPGDNDGGLMGKEAIAAAVAAAVAAEKRRGKK